MSSANLTRAETSARSGALTVHSYRVELDLSAAADPAVEAFSSTTTVEFAATAESTWFDFIGSNVESVTLNGHDVDVRYDGARILVDGLDAQNTVTIVAKAAYSRTGEGLHRFTDPVDAETYLYTQYEPADARRVFACFEQPDLKAPFTFVVHAAARWTVVSNQSVAGHTVNGDVQRVVFEPTLPISTYITAVIAGPYHREEGVWSRGERTVPLGVYCRRSLAKHLDADEFLEVTRQGLDFFADAFDYPYPWGKYDQVLVPEYNLGAMENPGCVTFTERYIFRGAATASQHERRATTILHEMAHMWFGDLVTMKWWDDLWLKESFADYMGSLAVAEATAWPDAWVSFAERRKTWAYLQDQLPTTHPIAADIVDLEAAKLNFDGITYAKGAAVLKQLVAYVGRDAFFDGARHYFREHAFGNTTLNDLLEALEQTSGRDLRAWSTHWLETTGVTTLTVAQGPNGLAIVPSDDRPHRLAVGWYDADASGAIVRRARREFDVAGEPVGIGDKDAALVLLNDGDLTYAKVRLDERSLATVEAKLSAIVDPLARGLVWSSLWNATRDGDYPVARYLAVARGHATAETNTGLLAAVLGNALFAIQHYVPESARTAERSAWLRTTWSGMTSAEPGSGAQLAWARAVAGAASYDDGRAADILAILDGSAATPEGLALDPDLRWSLSSALATTGNADESMLLAELARDDTASGRTALIEALASRPLEWVKADAWNAALTDTSLSNDHLEATIAGFTAGGRRDLTARHDGEYFAALREVWAQRSIEMAELIVDGLFPRGDSLTDADAWLSANDDAPAALLRLVAEGRDYLARDLRVRAAQHRLTS
jgi:aminopeptidase N